MILVTSPNHVPSFYHLNDDSAINYTGVQTKESEKYLKSYTERVNK